jgi:hypothetical protein
MCVRVLKPDMCLFRRRKFDASELTAEDFEELTENEQAALIAREAELSIEEHAENAAIELDRRLVEGSITKTGKECRNLEGIFLTKRTKSRINGHLLQSHPHIPTAL